MVYNVATTFFTTPDYIINNFTYDNLLMYSKAAPSYDDDSDDWDDRLDANNPNNCTGDEEVIYR